MLYPALGFILGLIQSYYWLTVPDTPPGWIRWFLILSGPLIYGLLAYELRRRWVSRSRERQR